MTSITYTNGNREITVSEKMSKIYVTSYVFDGVKWQTSGMKSYKTFTTAKRAAEKKVAEISQGWTKFPNWTITETV